MRSIITIALPAFTVFLLASCISILYPDGIVTQRPLETTIREDRVEYTILIKKSSYEIGQSINATFRINNESDHDIDLTFPTNSIYKYEIKNTSGDIILSSNRYEQPELTSLLIAKNESVEYSFAIPLIADPYATLPPGTYTLYVSLNYTDAVQVTISFTVN